MMQFSVSGMECGHCAEEVTRALKRVPGITDVRIDAKSGAVQVGGIADPRVILRAIEDAGYHATAA